jgi:hypothetical protein
MASVRTDTPAYLLGPWTNVAGFAKTESGVKPLINQTVFVTVGATSVTLANGDTHAIDVVRTVSDINESFFKNDDGQGPVTILALKGSPILLLVRRTVGRVNNLFRYQVLDRLGTDALASGVCQIGK